MYHTPPPAHVITTTTAAGTTRGDPLAPPPIASHPRRAAQADNLVVLEHEPSLLAVKCGQMRLGRERKLEQQQRRQQVLVLAVTEPEQPLSWPRGAIVVGGARWG